LFLLNICGLPVRITLLYDQDSENWNLLNAR